MCYSLCALQELEQEGLYNSFDSVHKYVCPMLYTCHVLWHLFYRQCLALVFLPIIEQELEEYVEFWNSHCIRSSRQGNCIGGIPNDLFDMAAYYGKLFSPL